MKKSVKILALIIVLTVVMSMIACTSQPTETETTEPETSETSSEAAEPEEEAESTETEEAAETIYIAMAVPITGPLAAAGMHAVNGAQMAVDKINADGGVNGAQIELTTMDDKNDLNEAALVAQSLSENDDIMAVIGHVTSSVTMAAMPIYQKVGMPVITPTANSIDLKGDNFIRLCLQSTVQGPQLGALVVNNNKMTEVGVIYTNNDFGISMLKEVSETIEKLGGTIVAEEGFTAGADKDFSAQLLKVQKEGAKAIAFIGDYNEGSLLIAQAARMGGFEEMIICGDSSMISDIFLERIADIGADMEKNISLACTFNPFDSRSVYLDFLAEFKEKFESDPIETAIAAYDAVNIISEALKAGATRETLTETIRSMEWENLLSSGEAVTFDIDGNRNIVGMDIIIVKDGEFAPSNEKVDITGVF